MKMLSPVSRWLRDIITMLGEKFSDPILDIGYSDNDISSWTYYVHRLVCLCISYRKSILPTDRPTVAFVQRGASDGERERSDLKAGFGDELYTLRRISKLFASFFRPTDRRTDSFERV